MAANSCKTASPTAAKRTSFEDNPMGPDENPTFLSLEITNKPQIVAVHVYLTDPQRQRRKRQGTRRINTCSRQIVDIFPYLGQTAWKGTCLEEN